MAKHFKKIENRSYIIIGEIEHHHVYGKQFIPEKTKVILNNKVVEDFEKISVLNKISHYELTN